MCLCDYWVFASKIQNLTKKPYEILKYSMLNFIEMIKCIVLKFNIFQHHK